MLVRGKSGTNSFSCEQTSEPLTSIPLSSGNLAAPVDPRRFTVKGVAGLIWYPNAKCNGVLPLSSGIVFPAGYPSARILRMSSAAPFAQA